MQPPSAPASASERSRDRRSASAVGREATSSQESENRPKAVIRQIRKRAINVKRVTGSRGSSETPPFAAPLCIASLGPHPVVLPL